MTELFKDNFANRSFINQVTQVTTKNGKTVTLYVKTSLATDSVEYLYSIGGRANEEMESLGVSSLASALVFMRNAVENY